LVLLVVSFDSVVRFNIKGSSGMKRSYRQDAVTGKLIEIIRAKPKSIHSVGVFQELTSPVTGERIANRAQLLDHNKRTGMTNDLDSLREQTRRENERAPDMGSKHERKLAIKDAMEQRRSSGYNRNINYE